MNIIKNIITVIFLITSHQTILHAQENKRKEYAGDYAATFNDTPIIADEKNFAEESPDLAYGFMVLNLDFQEFMANKLNNRLAYEPTESSKRQKTSLLDDAIAAAEDEIKEQLLDTFYETLFNAVKNNKNPNKITAKHFIYTQQSPLVKDDLLSEIKNPYGRYQKILIAALMKDNHTYIEFLIKLGIDLDSLNFTQNKSIIALALAYESENILMALMQAHGINLNGLYETPYGKKPLLHMAIEQEKINMVKILLNNPDINVNIQDDSGNTPIMEACVGLYPNKNKIIDLLLQRADIDIHRTNIIDQNVLHFATVHSKNNRYIKTLIDAGVDIDKKDKYDWTPLHAAIHNNQFYIVEILLNHGADKNMIAKTRDSIISNQTPLTCFDLATTQAMKDILSNNESH